MKAGLTLCFWKDLSCQARSSDTKNDHQKIGRGISPVWTKWTRFCPDTCSPCGWNAGRTFPSGCCSHLWWAYGRSLGSWSRARLGLTLLVFVHRTSMSTASFVPRPFMAFCSCRAAYSLGCSRRAKAVFSKYPLSSFLSTSSRSCGKTARVLSGNVLRAEGQVSALPTAGHLLWTHGAQSRLELYRHEWPGGQSSPKCPSICCQGWQRGRGKIPCSGLGTPKMNQSNNQHLPNILGFRELPHWSLKQPW